MSLARLPIRVLVLLLAGATACVAQAPTDATAPAAVKKPRPRAPQSLYNPNLVLLDPGHGGTDAGAKLGDDALEKDATIAFAGKLKALLTAKGFTVMMTHESAGDQMSGDQRAEAANRTRAVACILLHMANGGHGVHLFTSSLSPVNRSGDADELRPVLAWGAAQSESVAQSAQLAAALGSALDAIHVPMVVGQVSVPPIDSMTCPAVALELAPTTAAGDDDTAVPASDAGYQQRIADAVAAGLINWRTHVQGQIAAATMAATPAAKPATPPVKKPVPPTPKKPIPIETPVVPDASTAVPK